MWPSPSTCNGAWTFPSALAMNRVHERWSKRRQNLRIHSLFLQPMSRTYRKTCDNAPVNPFNTGLNSEATQIVLYDFGFCIYVIVFVFSVVFSFMGIGPLGITLAIIGHDLPSGRTKLQSTNAWPCCRPGAQVVFRLPCSWLWTSLGSCFLAALRLLDGHVQLLLGFLGLHRRREWQIWFFRFLVSKIAAHKFDEIWVDSGLTAGCWGALESFGISSSFANLFFGRIANAAREPPAFVPSVPAVAVVRNTQSQRLGKINWSYCWWFRNPTNRFIL